MSTERMFGIVALLLIYVACAEPRDWNPGDVLLSEDTGEFAQNCSLCHGTEDSPAPPRNTSGESDATAHGVGWHQAHLEGANALAHPIPCDTCHVVPATVNAPGHLDDGETGADLKFGGMAVTNNLMVEYVRETSTCKNVYCHGATLSGGSNIAPDWDDDDSDEELNCGSCHGFPPPDPHPSVQQCSNCHADTVTAEMELNLDFHINGKIDLAYVEGCSKCHGSEVNPAPPLDSHGNTDTTELTVGAHQAHIQAMSGLTKAVSCSTCHTMPTSVDAVGHMNDSATDVSFKNLAVNTDLTPVWDRDSGTCSNVYCHGANLKGGSNTAPVWNVVDGTQDACGTCHGFPPPAPHTASTACAMCHGVDANGSGGVTDTNLHINGEVNVKENLACNSCHGNDKNAAPPTNTLGESDTSIVTVGAHQAHLGAPSGLSKALTCDDCHVVPAEMGSEGHMDGGNAELTFGAWSKTGGLEPTWDRDTATCSNTYCHGGNSAGGDHSTPKWTVVDKSQITCAGCHGAPPSSGKHEIHEDLPCKRCHEAVVDGEMILDKTLHLNGASDVQFQSGGTWSADTGKCAVYCHGEVELRW